MVSWVKLRSQQYLDKSGIQVFGILFLILLER